jgi:putative membrane protein
MVWIARILTLVVAVEHLYILILEMFLWRTERARKAFGTTPAFAEETGVMAANQGLYNGFLAAGLIFSLLMGSSPFLLFFLACVVVAGLYGGFTVKPAIYVVQAVPATLALMATLLSH